MNQETSKPVDLGDKVIGEIELPTINIREHAGKTVKIAEVQEFKGQNGYYVRVITEAVATLDIKGKDDQPIILCASRNFGLQQTEQGIGWGPDTALGLFLKTMRVKHYRDLKGKNVITTITVNKKDGKEYLSFN